MVKALVEAGADVNLQAVGSWTPLMEAVRPNPCQRPRASAVCIVLLRAKADPGLKTSAGRTAEAVAKECFSGKPKGAYERAKKQIASEEIYATWIEKRWAVGLCRPSALPFAANVQPGTRTYLGNGCT